ncbi:hypothetical protein X947_4725 [Burkholderia pseudomallei MSHR7334]|nr:hypothetical protein DO73_5200 [Burkholderia pseudomallei]KGC58966.1 hypothetical protein DM75_2499 [Burkholderia mallei]KGS78074.1 hypothetical protein X947_4725 [Burkholderia pseudomallei MSHR7334]
MTPECGGGYVGGTHASPLSDGVVVGTRGRIFRIL